RDFRTSHRDRHQPHAARSIRSRCAAALARGCFRAAGAADFQSPRARLAARAAAPQFRRVRHRAEPRTVRLPMSLSATLARSSVNPREEGMRIAGEKVVRPRVIEVFNPYTEDLIGTVPRATVEDVRRAFAVAAQYQATLTRNERAQILRKTADILVAR